MLFIIIFIYMIICIIRATHKKEKYSCFPQRAYRFYIKYNNNDIVKEIHIAGIQP